MRDYVAWHDEYDDPASSLSWRLEKVRSHLRDELDRRAGTVRVVSVCAGDGRDLLGVLAERDDAQRVHATLVEINPTLVETARAAAAALPHVEVREGDAGRSDSYAGAVPADIVLMVGVFGNISDTDRERTVRATPSFCAPGALVLWSRAPSGDDRNERVRRWYRELGCAELDYAVADHVTDGHGATSMGAVRFTGTPQPLPGDTTLFTFER